MTTASSHSSETFECSQCGAPRMDFDADSGGLKCPQCGHTQAVTAKQSQVQERDLRSALSDTSKARGLGREMKAVKCNACGATTQVDPSVASTMCPFCGSPQVLEQKVDPNTIQPESIIPFQFGPDQAYQKYKAWLGKGFFRPKDVLQKSGAAQLQGVYLPFWTFDAHAESNWSAESGEYYYTTESYQTTEDGKTVTRTRQVQHTRWYPSSGHHSDDYDDVLVPGSTSGDQNMLQKIYPFDTTRLLPYQSEYLSGWAAEVYRVPLSNAWDKGQEVMQREETSKCDRQVPGDTHRNLHVNTNLSDTTFKHILLPVFLANYRYNTKQYHFMVNGQTGEVQGQAPIDWIKVAIVVVLALIVLAVVLAVLSTQQTSDSSSQLLPFFQAAFTYLAGHWPAAPPL